MSTTSEKLRYHIKHDSLSEIRKTHPFAATIIEGHYEEAIASLSELERENAALKRELVKIAASKTGAELDEDQYEHADFEGGYGILIDIARAALAGEA